METTEEERLYQLVMTRGEADLLEVLIVFADTMFRVVARDVELWWKEEEEKEADGDYTKS